MISTTLLVTAASAGLGRELVTAALGRGDRVVATSRRPEQLDDTYMCVWVSRIEGESP